ncbi:pyrimidine reductase family protein [Psychromicrobium xiongbiense]|uniref:pyrimidine reductase family protein n=1 Tax=Psychromicrobium xiongbiense TaxID=3051184 RepID=UPI002555D265|nr:pyrimidine reductase family protein [Psychromicrobium sp. YIM S02556]
MNARSAPEGDPRIDRLFPSSVADASDEQLLQWYGPDVAAPVGPDQPWVTFNFVSSLDGAATVDGRSGGLGTSADHRVFALLRRLADVILVGAQTIRSEGYAGELLDAEGQQWRLDHGFPAHPALAMVSGSLDLGPESPFFTEAPVRPVIFTLGTAPAERRAALAPIANVVTVGTDALEVKALISWLASQGLHRIHCEGGPHLFGTFRRSGHVDELCLSLSAVLAGGASGRIIAESGAEALTPMAPVPMTLAQVLRGEDLLLLRYLRAEA